MQRSKEDKYVADRFTDSPEETENGVYVSL